jgi:hypothetical protein
MTRATSSEAEKSGATPDQGRRLTWPTAWQEWLDDVDELLQVEGRAGVLGELRG